MPELAAWILNDPDDKIERDVNVATPALVVIVSVPDNDVPLVAPCDTRDIVIE
jgi:hypothetical protein